MIIDPLVVHDLPDEQYHAHPALSSSGARRLLPPYCPALFRYEQTHGGRPDTAAFDFGHAAHQLVLGAGQPIHRVHAEDWRTKAAQAEAAEARAAGAIPLLVKDVRKVLDMAKALKRHPLVGELFHPDRGRPEVSMFWHDEQAGIDRRARFDWLPNEVPGRQVIVPDYKSAVSANPDSFAKSVANYGYHQQDPWYRDAALACLGLDVLFVFVVQEKSPPYLVQVFELEPEAVEVGRAKNATAMAVYADCLATGTWPSYADGIVPIGLPGWADRQYL